jgi:multicomponent K+:H+ antiporter subunit E
VKRWLPAPIMSATLVGVWLLLHNTAAPGHVALACLLGWAIPLATARLGAGHPRLRRPRAIVRLGLVVLRDIVASNVEVARRVLGPEAAIHPGWLRVPLDLVDPHAITALAGIITMTPGTLTADIAPDGSHLLVHAFHVTDAEEIVRTIKARYEAPLKEIFE